MGKIATCDHFRMADWLVLPTTVDTAPFCVLEKGASAATHACGANGFYNLTMTAANEEQNLNLYMGDILRYDIDELIRVEWIAKITSAAMTDVSVVMGVASARNDVTDSVAANAWFKCTTSLAVVVETDDAVNDNDDKATGQTIVTAVERRFAIDFSTGVQTVSPPGTSKGGKGNVRFFMDDANGRLKQVASSTLFDMSNYTGNLQFYVQAQKASGTTLAVVGIKDVQVEHKLMA